MNYNNLLLDYNNLLLDHNNPIIIYYYYYSCVNNKMLEHEWLLTALIYGLIGCFRSKLSDLTCPITKICNRTGLIGQLGSQLKLSTSQ